MHHEIKILPEYFNPTAAGRKPFELRKNDRDYRVNDTLTMNEWNGTEYTGRKINCYVTYVLTGSEFGIAEGFCALGTRITTITKLKAND